MKVIQIITYGKRKKYIDFIRVGVDERYSVDYGTKTISFDTLEKAKIYIAGFYKVYPSDVHTDEITEL